MPALPIPPSDSNIFALDICLVARINFTMASTLEKRHAVVECLKEYADLCGDHLYLQDVPTSPKVVRFKPNVFARLEQWIDRTGPDDVLECIFTSAREDVVAASHYVITVLASTRMREEEGTFGEWSRVMGTLDFKVPWFWHTNHPKISFSDLVWRCANRLQAHSGWAGLGFAMDAGFSARHMYEPLINRIADRWPALLLDNSPYDSRYLRNRIREPGWITLVGDSFLAQIGGPEAVSDRLPHPIDVRPYRGGLFIQAGPEPDPNGPSIYAPPPPGLYDGPPSTDPLKDLLVFHPPNLSVEKYPLYRKINDVLKPVRVTSVEYPGTWQNPLQWMTRPKLPLPFSPDFPLTGDPEYFNSFIAALERRMAPPPEGTWLDDRTLHRWIARFDNPSPWETGEPSLHLNLSGLANEHLISLLAKLRAKPH